ncbi:hypothetical protein PCASD_13101 [Puccinia coronata f. sp. avenae]|uniref:Uncharacterized protein n=1 Tax=Puccinia coronata f. sp. avenae TaxID=200324 RepID=A0A2N5U8J8_9BASI|nr:hypothetical protein PCASD_13101 [Puccinia coronata f. sp. avenae]
MAPLSSPGNTTKNPPTTKPRRTSEQIRLDAQLAAAKKLEKALQKSAAARKKEAKKTAQDLVKAAEASAATTCFVWSKAALVELLGYVKMLKDEHDKVMKQPGFTPFSKFFLANIDQKNAFPLLVAIENNALLRQYRALMNMWRQVKDFTDWSVNAGLFAGLVQYGLSHSLWVVLLDMHGDNTGATGLGHKELLGDMEALLGTVPPLETTTEVLEAHDSEDNELPPTVVFDPATRLYGPPTGRKRQRLTEAAQEAMLTPAEQALDESPPPEELQHLVPPTTTATSVPAIPTATPTIADSTPAIANSTLAIATLTPSVATSTPAFAPSTPVALASQVNPTPLGSRPSAETVSIPCCRGKIEEAPKKDDSSTSMLMLMHKSSKQAAAWQMEERKLSKAQAEAKEQARQDQLAQAKSEAELVQLQIQLNRDAMIH